MLTAVVLTKNEEKNIERCIESLVFCDELIIVDDNSNDSSLEIAEKYKVKIYQRPLHNNFSEQRNFGMQKAKEDWILFIDADEEVTEGLKREIMESIQSHDVAAYYIKRRDFFWGKELMFGETATVRNKGLIRLMKKSSGKWIRPVHEEFRTEGKTSQLNSYLNHYPHPSINEFLQDINTYSTLRAQELYKNKSSLNAVSIIIYPLAKFILVYFIKLGFLDGPAGFAYAFFMTFHSFLVRAKLYQYLHVHEKSSQ